MKPGLSPSPTAAPVDDTGAKRTHLLDVMELANTWSRVVDRATGCATYHTTCYGAGDERHVFDDHDFALLDARFPAVLAHKFSLRGAGAEINGHEINQIHNFWVKKLIFLPKESSPYCVKNSTDYYIDTVQHAVILKSGDLQLNVIQYTKYSDGSVAYGCDKTSNALHVSSKWLDTHYPGWPARLAAAQSLELIDVQLRDMLFSVDVALTTQTSLPVDGLDLVSGSGT